MTSNATVIKVNNNIATVLLARSSACSHNCADCAGCSPSSSVQVTAINLPCAKVGDIVEIEYSDKVPLLQMFFVFVLPIVVLICAYFITSAYAPNKTIASVASIISFVLYMSALVIYDKCIAKRKKTQVTITKIIK